MNEKEIIPVGTHVKVNGPGQNASALSNGLGIYNLTNWSTTIFTIMDSPKRYHTLNCYPLSLCGKFMGYVYESGITKITGYVLKKEYEYCAAAAASIAWGNPTCANIIKRGAVVDLKIIDKLAQDSVLDIWFDPYIEPIITLPRINGKDGVKNGESLVWPDFEISVNDAQELHNAIIMLNTKIEYMKFRSGYFLDITTLDKIIDYLNEI